MIPLPPKNPGRPRTGTGACYCPREGQGPKPAANEVSADDCRPRGTAGWRVAREGDRVALPWLFFHRMGSAWSASTEFDGADQP